MSALLYRFRGVFLGLWAVIVLFSGSGHSWLAWPFIVLLGVLLRIWARCFIGAHSRGECLQSPVLVQDGPYAWIRHPLYLSNVLIACGLLLFWKGLEWKSAALGIGLVIFYRLLAYWEDLHLKSVMGEAWTNWRNLVPGAWLPRRIPKPFLFRASQSFGLAFRSDFWTWLWLVLVLMILILCKVYHVA